VARVRIDGAIYQQTVPATDLGNLVGKQLTEPVHLDQILVWPQLSSHLPLAGDQMAFTIPVTADTAAGGRIRPRDVVEVLVTTGKERPARGQWWCWRERPSTTWDTAGP
jgi:hypothetical protein